ncbi:MAG: ABC transporter permease [Hyphomicrobiales bacterium]|nr:ABC transporter permease [Hyphomicrobiales bacterium]
MTLDLGLAILIGLMIAATPLILAALGELVVEKAGVLNLGVEGMMVMGAVAGFAIKITSGSYAIGFVGAMAAGVVLALLFGLLTQVLLSNQVATGLALTLFGLGLSALIGQGFSGKSAGTFPRLWPGGLDVLAALAIAMIPAVAWFLDRTRAGLVLRAVGENHDAAHALGYPVVAVRMAAIAFGGAMAGLGGAYLSLVQTPFWVERMTAGRGWIALALVVFAAWRPTRLLVGAWLFGGITIMQLHGQGLGIKIDAQILSMLPYLATIAVLVAISARQGAVRLAAPACLGKVFYAST